AEAAAEIVRPSRLARRWKSISSQHSAGSHLRMRAVGAVMPMENIAAAMKWSDLDDCVSLSFRDPIIALALTLLIHRPLFV
ncbi:MAG: hypothetical protein AB7P20_14520, partial [Rhizobiaceae bacterium]